MVKVKFRYKDGLSKGKWSYQECLVSSLDECERLYGLDGSDPTLEDCEILGVEECKKKKKKKKAKLYVQASLKGI